MKRPIATVLLALALVVSRPALAWESLNDPEKNGRCAFMQSFDTPGQTSVVVSQDQKEFDDDDSVRLIVYDKNWSLQAGEQLGFPVSVTSNEVNLTVEGPSAVDNGLALSVTHEHMGTFAGANPRLVIIRKGDQAIARLDFAGFANAWTAFESCRADKVASRNERQKSLDEVPLNPFARGE
jgi:hypothetical protein